MKRCVVAGPLLLLASLAPFGGCAARETARPATDPALATRIEHLVEDFLTSDDEAKEASTLSDARVIFEQEGVPTLAKVGDPAAYGFVLMNMLGQSPAFRMQFMTQVQEAASRHQLPEDAVVFAQARFRQTATEERYKAQVPSQPALRDQISQLFKDDQAVRQKAGFDVERMEQADRRTAGPLKAIFDRYGVPTFDMVGIQAAKDFVVMVQHQSADFRSAVLPKLKANVDAGQAEAGAYAMVYDRTQRDQGRNQLYGEQLECASGKALEEAPMDDQANVNMRRAQLGLMRVELHARRLVRLSSPAVCGPVTAQR
jgi:hypothetical protein